MQCALSAAAPTLKLLSDGAASLGCLPRGFHLDPAVVQRTYRVQLKKLGMLSEMGRLNSARLASALEIICTPLFRIHGFGVLEGKESSLVSQFSRLVYTGRSVAHPLRHLLFSITAFGSWDSFLHSFRCMTSETAENRQVSLGLAATCAVDQDSRRQFLVELVKAGVSVTAAAARMGVAVATAMAWVTKSGAIVNRRPKKLTAELRAWAIKRLGRGSSKESVANRLDVSVQTVTLLLRTEPGLQAAWHQGRLGLAKRVARRSWSRTASRLAAPTASLLRELQPAVFAWLYRNDRAWLQAFAEGLPSTYRSNNAGVKWDVRDRDLSQAVRRAALVLWNDKPHRSPKLPQLCDAIDQLKGRLSNLDRLPLTRAAIADVTKRRRSC